MDFKKKWVFKLMWPLSFLIVHNLISTPKLTVMLVIDQCSYDYIPLIKKHLKRGLKKFIDRGINYVNASMPHGLPTTAVGHAALNTGAYAYSHGIIGNKWIVPSGKKVACDDDENAFNILNPQESVGPAQIKVQGITDSFVLAGTTHQPHHSVSISGKSRAAICTAGKKGKPFWFDDKLGRFTSSSYYFSELPSWITAFNNAYRIFDLKKIVWEPAYPLKSRAYSFKRFSDYAFTYPQRQFVGTCVKKQQAIALKNNKNAQLFDYLQMTPLINQYIFDLATDAVHTYVNKKKPDRMLLWICLSALDKVGHVMGPDSIEVIDMLYHLDRQIEAFMHDIHGLIGLDQTLFVLTADHGIVSIPEVAQQKGITTATRVIEDDLKADINQYLLKNGYQALCYGVSAPNIYINIDTLTKNNQKKVLSLIKKFLLTKPYVHSAWTCHELHKRSYAQNSFAYRYQQQWVAGRSGQVIIQLNPYCLVTDQKFGASHDTPYQQNTHVPLIVYQRHVFEQKTIFDSVNTLQIAPTLASILHVPTPEAAFEPILPYLFDEEFMH